MPEMGRHAAFVLLVIGCPEPDPDGRPRINGPPVANAGPDRDVNKGAAVTIDGSTSYDPHGEPIVHRWTQIAGTAVTLTGGDSATPSFVAPLIAGAVTFRLTVSDGVLEASDSVTFTVQNRAPIASAGPDRTVGKRTQVTLDGSASSDPDAEPLTYEWTQQSGPTVGVTFPADAVATFTTPGTSTTLVFELRVSDELAAVTDTVTITVPNGAPTALASEQQVTEGASVTLDGDRSSDPDGDPLTYFWLQTGGAAVSLSDPTAPRPTFTAPATPARIVLELAVSDGELSSVHVLTIQVGQIPPPIAAAGADAVWEAFETAVLDGSGSSDPLGGALTYQWSQISGVPVALSDTGVPRPTFRVPNADGVVTFELVVDNGFEVATDTVSLTLLGYGGQRAALTYTPHAFRPRAATSVSGYGLAVAGGRLYVAWYGFGLAIYDLTDPMAPSLRGSYPIGQARKVAVQGNYAYVANDGTIDLYIIDVSDPTNPTLAGSYTNPSNQGGAHDIDVQGGYAYLANGWWGFEVIDVTNPATPTQADGVQTNGYCYRVDVEGSFAYVANNNETLIIFNVANPALVTTAGQTAVPFELHDVAYASGHVYVADYGTTLLAYDVGNPATPALRATRDHFVRSGDSIGVRVDGSRVYAFGRDEGIFAYDITTPSNPRFEQNFTGFTAWDIAIDQGIAYVVGTNDLRVVDLRPSVAGAPLGRRALAGGAISVGAERTSVVVGTEGRTVYMLDVADPGVPDVRGSFSSGGVADSVYDVELRDGLAYVAQGGRGLRIFRLEGPVGPTQVGSYAPADFTARTVALSGARAFATGYFWTEQTSFVHRLEVLDVADPSTPARTADRAGDYTGLAGSGELVYAASGTELVLLDGSAAAVGTAPAGGECVGAGAGVAVLCTLGGIRVVDTSDAPRPVVGGSVALPGQSSRVAVDGIHAYVADGFSDDQNWLQSHVWVVDVAVPSSPVIAGAYAAADARDVAVAGDRVYVADFTRGLVVMETMPSIVWLAADHDVVAPGAVLTYEIHWVDRYPAIEESLRCATTGGTCAGVAQDQANATATVTWTVPSTPGDYEVRFAVGNYQEYGSVADRVRVQ